MNPELIYAKLEEEFPEFQSFWNRKENFSKKIDGSYTYCGLFSELIPFLQNFVEKCTEIEDSAALFNLFNWIEELLISDDLEQKPLVDSLKLCFLEKITQLREIHDLPQIGETTRQFLMSWDREI